MDLKEIKRLHDLGFAIHWVKPKSKVPLQSGWTRGPRASLNDLKRTYKKGLNVGVRLGRVSKIKEKYLAVFDLDIRSENPKHRQEAEKKLQEIFPSNTAAPKVLSGRGNGSGHFYILTNEPLSGDNRKAQSNEVVKVLMPSSEPSKRELSTLTQDEIKKGIRLRPAWEISLLSEGRQVVLPGSIHPDTNKVYTWERSVREIPVFDAYPVKSAAALTEKPLPLDEPPIDFVDVDVEALGLRPDQIEGLKTGEDVADRSAFAFSLCMALLQRRVSDNQILSVLTDPSFYMGQVGYDHAKTTSRQKAGNWVRKYCLAKAKEKVHASLFENEIVEEGGADWKRTLDRTAPAKGAAPKLKATFKNILLILENEISPGLIRRNLFSSEDFFAVETPWGYPVGQKRSSGQEDALEVKNWLINHYKIEPTVNLIEEVLTYIAANNEFHPVKDFLEGLEWDGVERIPEAFKTYLGADMPEPYLTEITRKFFVAMVKRIYEPGCKFDYLPVFEGQQGIGKSSFGSILVGKDWFMDGLPDLADKDAALNLQGIWIVEMGELSVLYRTQLEAAKAFITRQVDKVRPPYGRRRVDIPRQCVFLGTTDKHDYLQDSAGNRRFWPVKVEQVDFKALERDRLQLLAEAKFLYDFASEPLWLNGKAKAQAKEIQELRKTEDEGDDMVEKFMEFLSTPEKDRNIKDVTELALKELFDVGPFTLYSYEKHARSAVDVLKKAGYKRVHTKKGKRWQAN